MSAAWTTEKQEALRAWVVAATGLAAAKVLFARQPDGSRPAPPCVTIEAEIEPEGVDWLDVEDNPDSDGNDGEEILHTARGNRRIFVTFTAYGTTQAAATSPLGMLADVMAKLELPAVMDVLETAEISIGEFSRIQTSSGVVAAKQEPFAVLTATGFVASELTEAGTYVSTVDGEGEIE